MFMFPVVGRFLLLVEQIVVRSVVAALHSASTPTTLLIQTHWGV